MSNTTTQLNVNELGLDEAREVLKKVQARIRSFTTAGRKPLHHYEDWDWGKKNRELAEEHGTNQSYVSVLRKRLGKAPVPGGKHYPACLKWDWKKSNTEISRETGVQVANVQRWRKQLGKPPVKETPVRSSYNGSAAKRPVLDFTFVDWELPDIKIAELIGCTREFARQKRAEAGKPKRYVWDLHYEKFAETFKGIKELGYGEAVEKYGKIAHETFRKYCGRAGIEVIWGKHYNREFVYPWEQMNFELPNILLSNIWGPARGYIANWRSNRPELIGKAKFICRKGEIPEKFKAIVAAEREKFKLWKASKA